MLSIIRCMGVPIPGVAYESVSGACLAASSNCRRLALCAPCSRTTSTMGAVAVRSKGTRSASGSYGSEGRRWRTIVSSGLVAASRV